jgi:hypothetical protein
MRFIELDATPWTKDLDFYDALIAALGKPEDYSCNINALIEAMIWDYGFPETIGFHEKANEPIPPYTIRIHNTKALPRGILDEIELICRSVSEARAEFRARHGGDDVDVNLTIVS